MISGYNEQSGMFIQSWNFPVAQIVMIGPHLKYLMHRVGKSAVHRYLICQLKKGGIVNAG